MVMKKKMWAGTGILLAGCVLGAGGWSLAARKGGAQTTALVCEAQESAWESDEASSRKEQEAKWQEHIRKTAQVFKIYEEFGMSYDRKQNRFFYNGKMVRHFNDTIGESSHAFHHDEGVIDVIPLRDEQGKLTGLREATDEEFEERSQRLKELRDQFPEDSGEASCMELGDPDENFWKEYAVYEPFGLTCEKDGLYFEGEKVQYFLDGVELEEGCLSARQQYLNEEGTVDVHTVRTVIDNGDGSYNPFGELIRIERYSKEEFDQRDLNDFHGSLEATVLEETDAGGGFFDWLFGKKDRGASFEEIFEKYRDYGITYVEADQGSGVGNVYYNGEPVRYFVDSRPDGGVFSFCSQGGKPADGGGDDKISAKGGITVFTVYDEEGRLCGVSRTE